MNKLKNISPWVWVPTLYFAQGIPYFIVNNISVMMFAKMGVPNGQMALFTSLLYLPWAIKPFWSPFVDIIKTKRWWTIMMQIVMSAAFVLLTLSMPHPEPEMIASGQTPISMFTITLLLFAITAFASEHTILPPTVSICWGSIPMNRPGLWASVPPSIALLPLWGRGYW